MDVYFCDQCGVRVSDADLRRGQGVKKVDVVICGRCIDLGLGKELLAEAGKVPVLTAAAASAAVASPAAQTPSPEPIDSNDPLSDLPEVIEPTARDSYESDDYEATEESGRQPAITPGTGEMDGADDLDDSQDLGLEPLSDTFKNASPHEETTAVPRQDSGDGVRAAVGGFAALGGSSEPVENLANVGAQFDEDDLVAGASDDLDIDTSLPPPDDDDGGLPNEAAAFMVDEPREEGLDDGDITDLLSDKVDEADRAEHIDAAGDIGEEFDTPDDEQSTASLDDQPEFIDDEPAVEEPADAEAELEELEDIDDEDMFDAPDLDSSEGSVETLEMDPPVSLAAPASAADDDDADSDDGEEDGEGGKKRRRCRRRRGGGRKKAGAGSSRAKAGDKEPASSGTSTRRNAASSSRKGGAGSASTRGAKASSSSSRSGGSSRSKSAGASTTRTRVASKSSRRGSAGGGSDKKIMVIGAISAGVLLIIGIAVALSMGGGGGGGTSTTSAHEVDSLIRSALEKVKEAESNPNSLPAQEAARAAIQQAQQAAYSFDDDPQFADWTEEQKGNYLRAKGFNDLQGKLVNINYRIKALDN